ncbi:HTH-type transcriptional activator CmpR [Halomonas sp. THAF5a]|uniref:LysR substrate-binding domain-containing protein n=1 Tax=Halomonas sp. THAF5a TaxID=2587844 RepID=UPI0012694F4C|nr:LysR substrate-binding domain-containing protein [Halomonas sp. THAF5a]QFU01144.1 HTH-type transcriptional activator CmpR [Halomonas sp. THAF5a]
MSLSHAQLRAFHAVAVHGSFTRAAERLCLSQPAVSDQVRKLEERFGVSLLRRSRRTVALTDLGERLLGITQRLFAAADEAESLLAGARDLQSGKLTLAVDSSMHVRRFIARFQARHPGVRFQLMTGNTDAALSRLFEHRADFAVLGRTVEDPRLLSVELSRAPLIAFVPTDHPWARWRSIRLADLARAPLVLRERGSMTRQGLEAELRAAGMALTPAIEAEGREAVFELVAAGLGVGIVSAAEAGHHPDMHRLAIEDSGHCMTETLVCLRQQSERRLVAAFLEVVREALDTPEA